MSRQKASKGTAQADDHGAPQTDDAVSDQSQPGEQPDAGGGDGAAAPEAPTAQADDHGAPQTDDAVIAVTLRNNSTSGVDYIGRFDGEVVRIVLKGRETKEIKVKRSIVARVAGDFRKRYPAVQPVND